METDTDKIDNAALALLWLTLHDGFYAWKSFDWSVLDRLHRKGLIDSPVNKRKSVAFSSEGLSRAEAAFQALFAKRP